MTFSTAPAPPPSHDRLEFNGVSLTLPFALSVLPPPFGREALWSGCDSVALGMALRLPQLPPTTPRSTNPQSGDRMLHSAFLTCLLSLCPMSPAHQSLDKPVMAHPMGRPPDSVWNARHRPPPFGRLQIPSESSAVRSSPVGPSGEVSTASLHRQRSPRMHDTLYKNMEGGEGGPPPLLLIRALLPRCARGARFGCIWGPSR